MSSGIDVGLLIARLRATVGQAKSSLEAIERELDAFTASTGRHYGAHKSTSAATVGGGASDRRPNVSVDCPGCLTANFPPCRRCRANVQKRS